MPVDMSQRSFPTPPVDNDAVPPTWAYERELHALLLLACLPTVTT